jgi:phenylalanyl-tRNA synthetase beta chain
MQFPESWLREFCDPPLTTQQLADTLTMAGLEVEDCQPVAPFFSGVVVGEILSVQPHPDADRLRICQVEAGQSEPLSIVCGAPNARVGIKVPCATVGAQLPPLPDGKPFVIKLGKIRGVSSQGMLCSARELHIAEDSDGLLELSAQAPTGANLRDWLKLDDHVFTLKLTPNLAHCLSVHGIAREVSALTRKPLKHPSIQPVAPHINDVLPVTIHSPDLCGRFSGRIIKGLNPSAKTPDWMVQRLARCGQRSISALVDISNYVMFELGRPTHMFDLEKINSSLHVRWAHREETLELLNGQKVTLDEKVGVIADAKQVESLAGIMGGAATAVSDDTTDVYAEAAFWWPSAIAGRSRRFNFSTDAGHRFERGVDPQTTVDHLEYITHWVVSICGTPNTRIGPIDDHVMGLPSATPVRMRVARANKVLGTQLSSHEMVDALKALGLSLTHTAEDIVVTPPSYRFDLKIEEDLIEEVARMVGFDRLPTTPPQAPITPNLPLESKRSMMSVKQHMVELGYQETINFSFVDAQWESTLAGNDQPIQVLNPIASHMAVMRSSLMGSLLQVARFNLDRKTHRVRVFEVGRVFKRDPSIQEGLQTVTSIDQPMHLAGLALGPLQPLGWNTTQRQVEFFDIKADVSHLLHGHDLQFVSAPHPALHPGRSARIDVQGQPIGWLGELHPRWRQAWGFQHAPVLFELQMDAVLAKPMPRAVPVPKLHPVERDLAIVVKESVTHDALMACIRQTQNQGLLEHVVLFDIYRPHKADANLQPGEKSMAVRLMLQSRDEQTLTDAQIDGVVQALIQQLTQQLGARWRA